MTTSPPAAPQPPRRTGSTELSATRACHCLAARKRARALTRHYDRYLRPHGLRSTQFSVLAVLSQKGPTRLGELADILGLERTSLTRSADVLLRQGWVREAPAEDARERWFALTAAGLARLEAAFPDWLVAQRLIDEGADGVA
jgi:DNA-binding MarR family transcriptional regulator